MHLVYLLLGSNIGNSVENLNRSKLEIMAHMGNLLSESSVYKTEAWGFKSEDCFYNQIVLVGTSLSPELLLEKIHNAEKKLGRIHSPKVTTYESRVIDIDILFYDDKQLHTRELIIPHPMMPFRRFTLIPLNELAPDMVHPGNKQTVREMLAQCSDSSKVVKCIGGSALKTKMFVK